jgi:hypothetical protein
MGGRGQGRRRAELCALARGRGPAAGPRRGGRRGLAAAGRARGGGRPKRRPAAARCAGRGTAPSHAREAAPPRALSRSSSRRTPGSSTSPWPARSACAAKLSTIAASSSGRRASACGGEGEGGWGGARGFLVCVCMCVCVCACIHACASVHVVRVCMYVWARTCSVCKRLWLRPVGERSRCRAPGPGPGRCRGPRRPRRRRHRGPPAPPRPWVCRGASSPAGAARLQVRSYARCEVLFPIDVTRPRIHGGGARGGGRGGAPRPARGPPARGARGRARRACSRALGGPGPGAALAARPRWAGRAAVGAPGRRRAGHAGKPRRALIAMRGSVPPWCWITSIVVRIPNTRSNPAAFCGGIIARVWCPCTRGAGRWRRAGRARAGRRGAAPAAKASLCARLASAPWLRIRVPSTSARRVPGRAGGGGFGGRRGCAGASRRRTVPRPGSPSRLLAGALCRVRAPKLISVISRGASDPMPPSTAAVASLLRRAAGARFERTAGAPCRTRAPKHVLAGAVAAAG